MATATVPYGFRGSFAIRLAAETLSTISGQTTTQRVEGIAPADEVTAPGDTAKSSSTGRPKERRTLWMGDLDRAELPVDETYVRNDMFLEFSAFITHVRVCRDKITRLPSFGFVEFANEKHAQYVLEHMNGRFVPGRCHKYRLNWANFNLTEKPEARATFSRPPELNRTTNETTKPAEQTARRLTDSSSRQPQGSPPPDSVSLWIGSLDPATAREEVEELFQQHYASVCFVKLIMDPSTGTCRGFGFVHFRDPEEAERALGEMNGAICRGRRIRVNRSNNSRVTGHGSSQDPSVQSAMAKLYAATALQAQKIAQDYCGGFVPTKRKRGVLAGGATARVVVRGLDPVCTEEEVECHLSHFGEIIQTKVVPGGKAYVTFAEPQAADNAVVYMTGCFIGANRVGLEHAEAPAEGGCADAATADGRYWSHYQMTDGDYSSYGARTIYSGVSSWGDTPTGCIAGTEAWPGTEVQHYYAGDSGAGDAMGLPDAVGYANPSLLVPEAGDQGQCLAGVPVQGSQQTSYVNRALQKGSVDHAKRKGLIAATEEELSGGLFHDVDPAMVPADMLPPPMMADQTVLTKGTLERHVFFSVPGCAMRLRGPEEDEGFKDLVDEVEVCESMMHAEQERQVARKQIAKARLHEEDQEMVYDTPYATVLCF
ncbi:rna recognition motif-containing protein [Cystoisospora suis]|uniref:Rna recognition motif-containing protein n=1 Tax=Cystoisospora suis TaxID=483139 RepID=A0A2C6KZR0_9APIC|nr:rna recognition motif-containing protein [Cystoisospora suis]